jgi:uroporphyrinogen III methyltransferase/synthase
VFTSANGVDAFFTRGLHARGLDGRALAGLKIAAIGPGTAAALERFGLRADLVPERFVAESLVAAFPPPRVPAERVLLARAEQARDVLPAGLADRGYAVHVLPVYRTVTAEPDPRELERVRAGQFDAVTFTSSSTVESFCRLVGAIPEAPTVVSIGPITSATAVAAGLRVDIEADPHDIDGLVAAVLRVLERR